MTTTEVPRLTESWAKGQGLAPVSLTVPDWRELESMAKDFQRGNIACAYVAINGGWELWRSERGMLVGYLAKKGVNKYDPVGDDGFTRCRLPLWVLNSFREFLSTHNFMHGAKLSPSKFFAEIGERRWERIKSRAVPAVGPEPAWGAISIADSALGMIDTVTGPGRYYASRAAFFADVGAGNWRRKEAA